MPKQPHWWSIAAFVVGILVVGLPFWLIPYGSVQLPGSLATWSMAAIGVIAALLVASGTTRFWRTIVVTAGAVPAAIMFRVIVEAAQDPTSHNLFPFELALGIWRALFYVVPGAIVGLLVHRLRSPRQEP